MPQTIKGLMVQKDTGKASSLKITGSKAGTTKVIATVDGIDYTFNVTVQ